jgi:hypothetical protein
MAIHLPRAIVAAADALMVVALDLASSGVPEGRPDGMTAPSYQLSPPGTAVRPAGKVA